MAENIAHMAPMLLAVRRHAAIGLTVMMTLTLVGGARAWSAAAQGHRRVQESEVRQSYLYRQLADRDAVFESQRRIYMERFRRLEAEVREREQDVAVLRARLADRTPTLARDRVE
jgi:hypothetical protein